MEVRKINKKERAAFVRLTRYAFADWSEEEVDADRLAWADPETVIGVFEGGELAAGLKCFAADQSVRGVAKPMGAVSCVVTAPAYRNRGFARGAMQAAFRDMRERDLVVSMLRPFRESFYERLGYVSTNSALVLGFPAEALNRWLAYEPAGDWAIENVSTREGLDDLKTFWRSEALPRNHGLIFVERASEAEWKLWAKDTLLAFAKKDGRTHGLLRYKKSGFGEEGKLEVPEFFWTDADGRDLLLHFLARHRDQIGEIKLCLPYGTNFQSWLGDAPRPFDAKIFHLPWMVRLMDVAPALEGLPADGDGGAAFEVLDGQCEWNNGAYRLRAERGRLRAEKVGGEADLHLDIRAISALAYGALPTEELARRGWLTGGEGPPRDLLDRWFPSRVLFNKIDF